MNNNDILRRVRYIFDFNDKKVISIFEMAGLEVSREEISNWLKKDDDDAFDKLKDEKLAIFLNGLISDQRGKKEGPPPVPEKRLSNNIIFRKLKIACDLKSEDVIELLHLADFTLSNHELSAFFRKIGHKHYRECNQQVLRYFLQGLQLKYREEK
ncbi:MAG: hypothetical protein ACI9N9_002091 [Enterobacterales bacterium]|jgi:uncharacterized protein YehS (DUF1456 family)